MHDRQLQHVIIRDGLGRIDDRRDLCSQKLFIHHTFSLSGQCLQIGVLDISDHLQAVCVKIIKITRKLQCRPVDLIGRQLLALQLHLRCPVCKVHFLGKFYDRYTGLCIHTDLLSTVP